MLYTEKQVEFMLLTARANPIVSIGKIMSETKSFYLPDDDDINDAGYDEVGPDGMENFKEGGEWVKQVTYARVRRADEELERQHA